MGEIFVCFGVLTFIKLLEFFLHECHVFVELLLLLLFEVILRKYFQVDLRNFFIFAVEFIELFTRIRLVLSVR